jgi:hypothetical protein
VIFGFQPFSFNPFFAVDSNCDYEFFQNGTQINPEEIGFAFHRAGTISLDNEKNLSDKSRSIRD